MAPTPKFDHLIANPPYQNQSNQPIFQHFQNIAEKIAHNTEMIYMATRWWYGTSGLQSFRESLLTNPRLSSITYYTQPETTKQIFPGTEVGGGVCIVRLTQQPNKGFWLKENATKDEAYLPHNTELLPIKASQIPKAQRITTIIEKHRWGTIQQRGELTVNELRLTGAQLSKLNPQPTTEDAPAPEGYIKIYANLSGTKGGRSSTYLIPEPVGTKIRKQYKVCLGQSLIENENRPLRLFLFQPDTAFGRSSMSLAYFDTFEEAENFYAYAHTSFFEEALRLTLAGRLQTFGSHIPDLLDYTPYSPVFAPLEGLSHEEKVNILDGYFSSLL